MLFFLRFFYAPTYFIGFVGISVLLIQNNVNYGWLLLLLATALCISFISEKTLPYEPIWNYSKNDIRRDWLHAFINEINNILSITMIPLLTAITAPFHLWPDFLPLWLQLLFAILIADFGFTIAHYVSHKVPTLWRFHAVHHSVMRMYGFNGLMKHPLHQAFELVAGTAPLLLIGMPTDIGVLLAFAVVIQLNLQHSNVDIKIGPFIYIWAVAPGHRHHHIASKTHGDVNFGLFTLFWDHLLGTFIADKATPRDGELGIDGQANYPTSYFKQLLKPFR